jgi:hypothetical protein
MAPDRLVNSDDLTEACGWIGRRFKAAYQLDKFRRTSDSRRTS